MADTAHNPQTGSLSGTQVGRFAVGERVGMGGMGEVYVAEDTRLHRRVALKRLAPRLSSDENYRQRFLREAEHASRLSDPHVAAIYDVIDEGENVFLILEYVEGQTLRERGHTPISIPEVIQIALQCAEALRSAHAAGLVHCDIKPDNIMLATRPKLAADAAAPDPHTTPSSLGLRVKVLDFGVAKLLPVSDPNAPTTDIETQVLSGTPGYIAPEVLRDQVADGRADIFSLGVVLYELLAGKNPFQDDTIFATAERVMHEDPPPLRDQNPNVSRALEAVITRMLAKDRNQRYADADELLSDLRKLEGPVEVRELIAGTVHGPKRWHTVLLIFVGLIFSVGLLVAGYKAGAFGRWMQKAPPMRNIAVLPFSAPGDDATRAFSDGLAETLAAKLTGLTDRYPIQIVPPSEVREQGVTTSDQARQVLGVNLVLVGTLRASGGMVRVNYSLIDANTRRQVRGDSITADAANPFAVEDRVVDSVLNTLEIALDPSERRAMVAHRTSEPQAYDYYLQARGYLQNPHKMEDLDSAIDQFQRALERDPNYALAYAGLGEAYWFKYDNTKDPQWINKAMPACERAVALDMGSAEAHLCLGMADDATGKYDLAAQELQRAVELQPTSDEAVRWLARSYEDKKDLPQAEASFKRALSLRPSYWGVYNALGAFYFRHSRFEEATEQFHKAASMSPDNFRAYSNLGGVYLARGDYNDAISNLERSVAIRPTGAALSNLGAAYFYLRRFSEAARTYEQATKLEPSNHILWGNLGEAYYWTRGKQAETRRALTEALRLTGQDLKINPRDIDALRDGAGYYAMLGDKAEAFQFLQRGFAVAPDNADTLFKAAAVHQLFGETGQALNWLRKALAAGYGPERIRDDAAFDNLKDNPQFQDLISQKK